MSSSSHSSLHCSVLGSSSSGNSTVIWDDGNSLLIDCGFGPRYILGSLRALGVDPRSLRGVILTHVHGDHVEESAVRLMTGQGVPFYSPESVVRHLPAFSPALHHAASIGLLRPMEQGFLQLGPFDVAAFAVPHDSPGGCYGYVVERQVGMRRRTVAVTTDLGYVTDTVVTHLTGADVVVLESNHDPDMLEQSSRPLWLKRRIREIGHLSNPQCAGVLTDVLGRSAAPPKTVILAHLSRQCNTPALAVASARQALDAVGCQGVSVIPAHWHRPGIPVSF